MIYINNDVKSILKDEIYYKRIQTRGKKNKERNKFIESMNH